MQAAVDFIARCIAARTAKQVGKVSMVQLTKEEYDALDPKDPNTLYFVYVDNNITQYMGDTKLTAGTVQNASMKQDGLYSILADIVVQEV